MLMSKTISIITFSAMCLLAACRPESPSEAFQIPPDEVASVTDDAEKGDIESIRRLIAYYEGMPDGSSLAAPWKAKARLLADADELSFYAEALLIEAKREPNVLKRKAILQKALAAAMRSDASKSTESSREAVQEIRLGLTVLDERPPNLNR